MSNFSVLGNRHRFKTSQSRHILGVACAKRFLSRVYWSWQEADQGVVVSQPHTPKCLPLPQAEAAEKLQQNGKKKIKNRARTLEFGGEPSGEDAAVDRRLETAQRGKQRRRCPPSLRAGISQRASEQRWRYIPLSDRLFCLRSPPVSASLPLRSDVAPTSLFGYFCRIY